MNCISYDETYNEATNNAPPVCPKLITDTLPFDVVATMTIISELITRTKTAYKNVYDQKGAQNDRRIIQEITKRCI